VANIYHAFAIQCFTDGLAHAAGRDPLDYLLDLIGKPRTIDFQGCGVPELWCFVGSLSVGNRSSAACNGDGGRKIRWGKRKHGKGAGVGLRPTAVFCRYVATVVEVEVNAGVRCGSLAWITVLDAGLVVNPRSDPRPVRGRRSVWRQHCAKRGDYGTKGAIDQSKFSGLSVARIGEAPSQTNVYILDSDARRRASVSQGCRRLWRRSATPFSLATGKRVRICRSQSSA